MKIKHTTSISIEEILDAVKALLKKKNYEFKGSFGVSKLKPLLQGKTINLEVVPIHNYATDEFSFPSRLFFHEAVTEALKGQTHVIGVFFSNVSESQVQIFMNQVFQSLDEGSKQILIGMFQLDKPVKERTKQRLKSLGGVTFSTMVKAYSLFGQKLLDCFRRSISELELKDGDSVSVLLGKSLRDAGFSRRVCNSFDYLKQKTIKDLFETSEKDLLSLRNFGRKGLREISDLKSLYDL